MSIQKMPDDLLMAIMNNLDFRSIMNLRKTCRDFRNFIDDVIPSSSMITIDITVKKNEIELSLYDSKIAFRRVQYPKKDNKYFFWKDLELLLKHQKEPLDYFNMTLDIPDSERKLSKFLLEKVHAKFLQRLHQLLKSLKAPIPVRKLYMCVGDQDEVMMVLPHVNAQKLEEISIFPGRGKYWQVFKLDRVIQTEQWKMAKQLQTINFMVEEPMESFTHFDRCQIYIETLTPEIVKMLKEAFIHSPSLECFSLNFEPTYKSYELKRMLASIFEHSFEDPNYAESGWYSVIPEDREHVLQCRTTHFSWFNFSREKLSVVRKLQAEN